MHALFVHDHIFPKCNGRYYYSSGFDADFFKRYLDIFDSFSIFARYKIYEEGQITGRGEITEVKKITTIAHYPDLFCKRAIKDLLNEIKQSDAVVIRMNSVLGSFAILFCRQLHKKYLVENVVDTYAALANSESIKRKTLACVAERFYRYMAWNNPYTVYVTENFLEEKYPCNGEYIHCSNVSLKRTADDLLDRRYDHINEQDKKIVIGTCGTLDVGFKGQQFVVEALPMLLAEGIEVEYQMVGDGNSLTIEKIAKKNKVESRINIIGRLNHEDVLKWLDTIDIYVHPSCQEGLSRAVIEAMSRACPIISAEAGGIHELIDESFIVPPRDSKSIVNSIKKMTKKEMRNQASKNWTKSQDYCEDILNQRRKDFFFKAFNPSENL